jgi:hypothetical protein
MKKLVVFAVFICIATLAFAGGKKDAGGPAASWDWVVNGDADNGGTSTIEMKEETLEGLPAYSFTGNITNDYEYGFVNVKLYPDTPTLELLKKAKAISFRVLGDGEPYAAKITTSDISDYAYYEYRFDTVEGQPMTIIVPVDYFMQPSWGKPVGSMINLDNAQFVEYQTTRNGSPGPYAFKLWDFRVHTAGIPTEKDVAPKGKVKAAAVPAAPKGIGGDLGALTIKILDNFQYGDGYQGEFADKRMFNGHKIVPGESYTLKITYTASRDLEGVLQVGLVDRTPNAAYWGPLSWDPNDPSTGMAELPQSKAGEKVSATIEFKTIKGATGASGVANSLVFTTAGEGKKGVTNSGVKKPFTLDFTEFVFTENK